ncbi:MAG: hypothetical protein V3V62_05285 [bacterium]
MAAAVLLPAGGGARAGEGRDLRLCNPEGGIRAERTRRGLRIQYLGPEGGSAGQPFTLRGWEVRAAVPRGGGVCLDLVKPGSEPEEEAKKTAEAEKAEESKTGDILRARDEVFETGGAFQEKVIYRRTQKVIELGGERIVIEGVEVVHPKGKGARKSKAGKGKPARGRRRAPKKPKGAVRDDR